MSNLKYFVQKLVKKVTKQKAPKKKVTIRKLVIDEDPELIAAMQEHNLTIDANYRKKAKKAEEEFDKVFQNYASEVERIASLSMKKSRQYDT